MLQIFQNLNETGIPKIFWYFVSLTLFSLNIGLIYLVRKAQSVNIEAFHTKLQIIRTVDKLDATVQSIKTDEVSAQDISGTSELERNLADLKIKAKELEKSL